MTCINCHNEHKHKFCPNCGEKADVDKITFASLIQNGASTITNMDKGFLYNIKSLIVDPQKFVQDYIRGKRKGILNPISFLIICVTLYLIADSFVSYPAGEKKDVSEMSGIRLVSYESGYLAHQYLKYFWILSVIWLSMSTKLFFGKYNFTEHLAINSFIIGVSTLFGGLIIYFWIIMIFNPIIYLAMIWMLYKVHLVEDRKADAILIAFGSIFFFFILFCIFILCMGAIKSVINPMT